MKRTAIEHRLLATGQHGELFDDALSTFGLRPDARVDVDWRGLGRESVKEAIAIALKRTDPDLVLVQGDTDSALVAAQVAYHMGLPVGHLEAGLRSFDLSNPFPEEQNRVAIAKLATLHFAPSVGAAANLRVEDVKGQILVTGNTGIDALLSRAHPPRPYASAGPILATCHRRENFGAPLQRICAAIADLSQKGLKFLVPLHSNPNSAEVMRATIANDPNITLSPPLSHSDLISAVTAAPFVLSDSGGLQEECAALGVPLLLLRENTERPEVVASGNCILVGSDPALIIERSLAIATDAKLRQAMAVPTFPYGQGGAAEAILDAIETWRSQQSGYKSIQYDETSFCADVRQVH